MSLNDDDDDDAEEEEFRFNDVTFASKYIKKISHISFNQKQHNTCSGLIAKSTSSSKILNFIKLV